MSSPSIASDFEAYSLWRGRLSDQIADYRQWLNREDLNESQRDLRLQQLLDRLAEDKLHVAFIAEFSRGKSELINAIFLSDMKQRLLPSTAGRTTMCPTELLYDPAKPPQIELLAIETRGTSAPVSEYRNYPEEWTRVAMDIASPDRVREAMQEVCRVKSVSIEEATRYGLYDPEAPEYSAALDEDGKVAIPAWRHAIINFPHPFLEKGLVVYDTPGLNAIGVEPELTYSLLPNAHAVLFVLSADAGVTKSDIQVWRDHINMRGSQKGRLVALNKIDGLWDALKTEEQINAEIDKQVKSCADMLGIEPRNIFPVSAQKGLQAKIQDDPALLQRSRLGLLEKALSEELIASKQELVRDQTEAELDDMLGSSRALLQSRFDNIEEQLNELRGLQGKNQDVVEHIMVKIAQDKEAFERGLQHFQALRSVFSQQSVQLFQSIGTDTMKNEIARVREAMVQSRFTKGIREAMNAFFRDVDRNMEKASGQVDEINHMMEAMYRKLSSEHGMARYTVPAFSMLRYRKELQRLETAYNRQINNLFTLLTTEQYLLTTRFFETVANRVVKVFEIANREVEAWLRAVMSPMESQIREHQMQLRRRLESVKRIHKAAGTLEDRIDELLQMQGEAGRQLSELDQATGCIHDLLSNRVAASEALAA
ncbi:MAG: dynamin family protein [Gallionellaceae bacterium]|nr:dynamin family protein [Gallionellaceae bacterium]MDD5367256.1 dynamin family protein [Gallionellaceae bacterium]